MTEEEQLGKVQGETENKIWTCISISQLVIDSVKYNMWEDSLMYLSYILFVPFGISPLPK